MAKFVVLDHTLRSVDGHHFDYAVQMLSAAERHGWQPVLGAHRDLRNERELAPSWEIHRSFRGMDYGATGKLHLARLNLATARQACGPRAWARGLRCRFDIWRYRRRFERLKQGYAAALDEIWAGGRLTHGDQIFIATARPLDIAALADWASRNPAAREVDWHLQVHFPLVDAETWYADSGRRYDEFLQDAPRVLQDVLAALPRKRVHLYSTTESLAGQLQHWMGERFQTLPYPVNPAFAALRAGVTAHNPLRATCAGERRGEKGAQHSAQVVGALKQDYFATGRLQLAVQTKSLDDLSDPLRKLTADLASPTDGRAAQLPVVHAGWPLSPPEYLRFLAGSDIGLLMYDALAYHVRCSGVLVEMLNAGVPLVVPAGCWLADQIAEPIFEHQEQLRQQIPLVGNLTAAEIDWKVAVRKPAGIAIGVDGPGATVPAAVGQMAVPSGATHLLVLLARDAPNPWNYYCSANVEQRDAAGRPLAQSRDTIGYRDAGRPMTVLVPLTSDSRQIEIGLQTAFGHEPFLLRQIECCFLAAPETSMPAIGAVGRLMSEPAHAADCLRDIVDHYDHYQKTARAFAATWAPVHTADQVLSDLTARAGLRGAERREVA